MKYIYSAGLLLYYLGILIVAPFSPKARLWIKGRKRIFGQISETVKSGPLIWFHVASLGEFEQGRPVMEEIKHRYNHYKILLTFFSPSGYEIRRNYAGADYIFYLPLDLEKNARRFIQLVKPAMAIFVKYEFWYHYIHQLYVNKIPVYLISGIFRPGQFFFRWYGKWFRKMLFYFEHFFVQTQESLDLLHGISLSNVTLSGDTRFDRVLQIASGAKDIPVAASFKGDRICLIAGSTWPGDEHNLISYINNYDGEARFIIAPHEVHEDHIRWMIRQLKKPFIRYSEATKENVTDRKVLIIDNIGMLSSLYRFGDIAYIGGGFGAGIHNILEAATFGLPIIFGPNYAKFNEAVELIGLGGAMSYTTLKDLTTCLNQWLDFPEERFRLGKISKDFVCRNAGATGIIVNRLFAVEK
ncbi:MAG: 3-deoxy-D-manno-octulosonic acid transferase [Bacteroidales bacterium]|nr:3-deoxy-D-manno-octulosonic acid transferase [Bacteroidales bacterium]